MVVLPQLAMERQLTRGGQAGEKCGKMEQRQMLDRRLRSSLWLWAGRVFSMSFAFKKFGFFQQQDLPGPGPLNATCFAANSTHLFAGCDNGSVRALNERAEVSFSFAAHGSRVFHAVWVEVSGGEVVRQHHCMHGSRL